MEQRAKSVCLCFSLTFKRVMLLEQFCIRRRVAYRHPEQRRSQMSYIAYVLLPKTLEIQRCAQNFTMGQISVEEPINHVQKTLESLFLSIRFDRTQDPSDNSTIDFPVPSRMVPVNKWLVPLFSIIFLLVQTQHLSWVSNFNSLSDVCLRQKEFDCDVKE